MRELISFLLLVMFLVSDASTQENIAASYYFSTEDFIAQRKSDQPIVLEIKKKGPEYIQVKDFVDPMTGEESREARKAWAIEVEDETYLNLLHSISSKAVGLLIKLDLTGRFCLAVMDEEFVDVHNKETPALYGGGIAGAMLNEGGMYGGMFLDSTGVKKRIFFVDTKDLSIVIPYKGKNAPIDLLTVNTLKWLVGKENFKGRKWDYTVEEIVAIVDDLNHRQKKPQ
jgi:hypothetical protein